MKFIFDLDGTLTLKETLPLIASAFGKETTINQLTQRTIRGDIPFVESFIKRVDILGKIPEKEIDKLLESTPLNEKIISFIRDNSNDCIVVTGNYSGWIHSLSKRIPCRVISSTGFVDESGAVKITNIIKKEEVVQNLKATGEEIVFIGDGNNDAEAMRISNVAIACGIVHYPARSVLSVANFLVLDSDALLRLLNQIRNPSNGFSVVISSAGIGSRLGFGQTKALIKIHNKTLIQYQLELFKEVEDIRVVVGYQADEVINHVKKERTDVIFVFNHDYFHTKTGASLYLGSRFSNEFVIAWDGDLVVHPEDVQRCLQPTEYIGCSKTFSKDTVFVEIDDNNNVTRFATNFGDYEWTGPACLRRDKIRFVSGHVYSIIESHLPIKANIIRAFDIDTNEDYEQAGEVIKNWNLRNDCIDAYYRSLSENITDPIETRNKSRDFTEYDVQLVLKYSSIEKTLLDLGTGTGLLVNRICRDYKSVTAVEKYEGFSRFITKADNVKVVNSDLLEYNPDDQFNVITIFGVMNFFNNVEALKVYKMAHKALKKNGIIIVKNQMGVEGDVIVNGFSEELGVDYYSHYRSLKKRIKPTQRSGL